MPGVGHIQEHYFKVIYTYGLKKKQYFRISREKRVKLKITLTIASTATIIVKIIVIITPSYL